jgi:predicted AlkP superfamily pyrophosphatase or phosphodiesterase
MRFLTACAVVLLSSQAFAKSPKLTLLISIDSFSSDLYLRSKPKYKAGLLTLARDGAVFPTARYESAETVTAAGHATIATGAHPWRHGIVSNRLIDRATGKTQSIFVDQSHPVLDAPPAVEDSSPLALLAETLSDRLVMSTGGKGKAIAIAGKGRAAIALGGKLGTAYWFHEQVGKFVTGTYYKKEFPTWLKAFNDKKPADQYFNKPWQLLLPKPEYLGTDDRPFEADVFGLGRVFPHQLTGGISAPGPQAWSALASSPYFTDIEVQLAKAAIDGEQLGKDDVPDMLAVSISAFDRIYHLFGPYSWEMQDAVARLDKSLAELIAIAEKAAGGRANLLVVLTADHGGAAIPEEWAAMGLNGVRINAVNLEKGLEKELSTKFNAGDLVLGIEETDVYLDQKAIADKKLDLLAVRRWAAQWLRSQPELALAVSRDDLSGPDPSPGFLDSLRKGFHPDRSGDVLMVSKQYHVLEVEPSGTSHGTPYSYDAEVPFILLGKGVKPGLNAAQIRAVDIAPTVAALMEIGNPAQCEGSARGEAVNPLAK